MKIKSTKRAFTLVESSVVILITGILVVAIASGSIIVKRSKLVSAQSLTKASSINSTPDLVFWMETSLDKAVSNSIGKSTPVDNEAIATVKDISSGNIKLSQATTTRMPTYIDVGINNLPSLSFDGVDDILYATAAPILHGKDSYTIIAVWRQLRITNTSVLVEQKPSGASFDNLGAAILLDTNSVKFSASNNNSTTLGALSVNKNCIGVVVVNKNNAAANVSGYLNTNTATQVNTTSPASLELGDDLFSIGGRILTSTPTYDTQYSRVLLSEVVVFNRTLTQSEIISINSYLSKKYNIAVI